MEIAGRYVVDREVGRGGMGSVWLGTDRVLGRLVALKRLGLAPGVGAPDFERAEREARLAARLNHPHVVAVFDLVEEGSDHWLVMEYVEGRTLAELVRDEGALGPDEAAPLLRQAADALAAAHASGIVHRDVKPSNILVTDDGQVKLSDFGIARAEADASLTQTGLVTGSPAYLAPEVASGQMATAAADVWSLGATAYHALSGRPPYEVADNLMGALYRIVNEEPPRLANAGWMALMLENTMTRDPAERWSMARVRDFLEDGPLSASKQATDTVATRALAPADVAAPTLVAEPDGGEPEGGTQVMPPAGVPPVQPVRPVQPVQPAVASAPLRRRRPSGNAIGVLAALAALVLFLLLAWLFGAFDQEQQAGSRPGTNQSTSSNEPTDSETSEPSTSTPPDDSAAKAEAMQGFVTDYVAAAIEDPKVSWEMLTPEFKKASKGFGSYKGYWDMWDSATPANIKADPESMTVSYDITYTGEDGTVRDSTVLTLQETDGGFLIAKEGS